MRDAACGEIKAQTRLKFVMATADPMDVETVVSQLKTMADQGSQLLLSA